MEVMTKSSKREISRLMTMWKSVRGLSQKDRKDFLNYKCSYYQFFIRIALVVTCFAEVGFLISDIYLNDGEVLPTLIPRVSVLLPLLFYMFLEPRARGYRWKTFLNYALGECNVLATIWAVFHLKVKTHFAEGSFCMNLIFLVVGIGSSTLMCVCNYLVFFAEILVTNLFVHYESMSILMSLNIPAAVAVIFAQIMLTYASFDAWQMDRRLRHLVDTDPMTHAGNRSLLEQIVQDNQLVHVTGPVSLIMLDVDHFKKINDTGGHATGDQVLIFLAQKLGENTRSRDQVIRYGGDEFLIILHNCTPEGCLQYMKRVRQSIQNDHQAPAHFTISCGICTYDGDFQRSLKCADSALYEVKKSGRNGQMVWIDRGKETDGGK